MINWQERVGKPQYIALLILAVYLAQCVWLSSRTQLNARELESVGHTARDPAISYPPSFLECSPVVPSFVRAPLRLLRLEPTKLPVRLPFMMVGCLLGASLWYVSRRLYGNAGGYLALVLYAFSAPMIRSGTWAMPEIIAAWGAFGVVFTGIAVAHTLYAPREVVLWNWKRIVLLGLSLGFGIGAQLHLVILVPLVIAFMLYLAPHRRGAALAILGSGCVIGLMVAWMASRLAGTQLLAGLGSGCFWGFGLEGLSAPITYRSLCEFFLQNPAMTILLAVSLVTYAAWKRTRFFGVTAPLLVCVLLLGISLLVPYESVIVIRVVAVPFLFVFIAGVFADLLESGRRSLALAFLIAVLACHVGFGVRALAKL